MEPKTIAILGAGSRGSGFGEICAAVPQLAKVVAVAEPRDDYRQSFSATHRISPERQFGDWRDFTAQERMCDAVIIATMDRDHVGPAVACLERGYDVLLEKPMATTLADCQAIEAAQRRSGRIMGVCHSLRYHKSFRMVKDLVAGGAIGRIVTAELIEQVAFWHQAHSFVRGNWGNQSRSTFMLLAKSCHDVDYLCYLIPEPCRRVSSFGSLNYFRADNAPAASTDRCTDPCPVEPVCAYSAIKQYVDTGNPQGWPANAVSRDAGREARLQALKTGPYGRCVWKCDNDVVDHQVVNFEFAGGITATFTMTAFTKAGGRRLTIHGTQGELAFDESTIRIQSFTDGSSRLIEPGAETGGHGGGDYRLTCDWLRALQSRDDSAVVANAQESLRTHRVVFAAEQARLEGRVVTLD